MNKKRFLFVLIVFLLFVMLGILYFNSFSVEADIFRVSFRNMVKKFEYHLVVERSLGYQTNNYSQKNIPFLVRFNPFRKSSEKEHVGLPPQIDEYTFSKSENQIKCVVYHLDWRACYVVISPANNTASSSLKMLLNSKYPQLKVKIQS